MRALVAFIRATLIGGILFLLPIVVLAIVLGKAQEIASRIVAPLASRIAMKSMAGISTGTILAIGLLVLFCLLVGLFARTRLAPKIVEWLESGFLYNIPGYDFFKGISESLMGYEAVMPIRWSWPHRRGVADRLSDGTPGERALCGVCAGTPNVWSGSVYLMTEERFQRLDISRIEAVKCLRRWTRCERVAGQKMGGRTLLSGGHRCDV